MNSEERNAFDCPDLALSAHRSAIALLLLPPHQRCQDCSPTTVFHAPNIDFNCLAGLFIYRKFEDGPPHGPHGPPPRSPAAISLA